MVRKEINKGRIIIGIPARLESTRFPRKPLCEILGMSMIEHVYKRCELSNEYTFVATCDDEIREEIERFGGNVIMTNKNIKRPGVRIAEACKTLFLDDDDIVVVAQGDEPLVYPDMINRVAESLINDDTIYCAHLCEDATQEEWDDTNEIKCVVNIYNDAIYFSRSQIPSNVRTDKIPRLKQVCIFGFRWKNLLDFISLQPTPLELGESIEMLRALEHNKRVHMIKTDFDTKSVDTEIDRQVVEEMMKNDPIFKKYSKTET